MPRIWGSGKCLWFIKPSVKPLKQNNQSTYTGYITPETKSNGVARAHLHMLLRCCQQDCSSTNLKMVYSKPRKIKTLSENYMKLKSFLILGSMSHVPKASRIEHMIKHLYAFVIVFKGASRAPSDQCHTADRNHPNLSKRKAAVRIIQCQLHLINTYKQPVDTLYRARAAYNNKCP